MSDDNVVNLQALDPAGFRVPASDAKGHSIPKNIRIMPVLENAIKRLLFSKQFPYQSEAELIRHALVRHVRWLESIGDVPSVSGMVEAANEILIQEQVYDEFQEHFNSLRSRITYFIQHGEVPEAVKLISKMRSHFERMPEGYWRDQYERQLKEWDYLFDQVPKVSLLKFSKE